MGLVSFFRQKAYRGPIERILGVGVFLESHGYQNGNISSSFCAVVKSFGGGTGWPFR